MRRDDPYVSVYRAAHATEAHVIRGLLEQYDISVRLVGEGLSSGFGELPAEVIEVEIRVPVFHRQLARQLIEEFENRSSTDRDRATEWQCADCGESNPSTFGLCWNCRQPVDR